MITNWIEKSIELLELQDRAKIVHDILVVRRFNKAYDINFYDGRYGINSLFEDLIVILKKHEAGMLVNGIYKHYIFENPRLMPYYRKREYPFFSLHWGEMGLNEKLFIKEFLVNFLEYLNKLEGCLNFDLLNYKFRYKFIRKLGKFRERLSGLDKKL